MLSFEFTESFKDFKKLQYVTFSQLQILKFPYEVPKLELLNNFLEINGKTLREFYLNRNILLPNLVSFTKFCPNLRRLSIELENNKLEALKTIFNNCQFLESIKIWYEDKFMNERDMLEVVVKYSPKSFHEFGFSCDNLRIVLLPEELESILISWSNRIPLKPLSLFIDKPSSSNISLYEEENIENVQIFEKYVELGIVKKFELF